MGMTARCFRRSYCTTRNVILGGISFIAVFTIMYEVAIFNMLDYKTHLAPYENGGNVDFRSDNGTDENGISGSLNRIHADAVLHELSGCHDYKADDVGKERILNTVHFVWCGNRTFDFSHYLSVLSVWKFLQPDIIEFHMQTQPMKEKYENWFYELRKMIPSLALRYLPPNWDGDDKGCGFWFGLAVIDDRGGIYINENIIITEDIIKYRNDRSTFIYSKFGPPDERSDVAIAMGKDHDDDFRSVRKAFSKSQVAPDDAVFCQILNSGFVGNTHAPCYIANGQLYPLHIMENESEFAALARLLMYGSEAVKTPRPFLPGTIPRIVHYVWFGAKVMDFMMYLSMISALYIVNPDKVLVHTDGGLKGKYWDRILKDKRVVVLYREKPYDIYGHQVLYAQHRSDIARAEVLLKYGGIYMDWDALWLRNPDDLLNSGYDAMANFDHMQNGKYPETINLGVFLAKPKSTFVKRWQDALINYRSDDFLYNAVLLPYKIYEKFPEYIYIERHLQVMCFRLKCHPTFKDGFKNFMEEQEFDWRRETYSIHFTYPDPSELTNEDACRNGEGRFAEMGRHILTYEKYLPE